MKAKNIFRRATYGLKYGTLGAVSGTLAASIVIPVLGLAVHGIRYLGDENLGNDYSLKHRFETAYCFDTPDEHKYYHTTPIYNGYSGDTVRESYAASPYATYGTTAFFAASAALMGAGAGIAMAKEKEKQR